MRISISVFCASLVALSASRGTSAEAAWPVLAGPYLGQNTPGMTPEVFAPGLISTDDEYELNSVFSLDGDGFYYAISTTTPEEKEQGHYRVVAGRQPALFLLRQTDPLGLTVEAERLVRRTPSRRLVRTGQPGSTREFAGGVRLSRASSATEPSTSPPIAQAPRVSISTSPRPSMGSSRSP